MNEMTYTVWEVSQFDIESKQKLIAKFACLDHAKDFCDYQATLGKCNYAVFENNLLLYPLT